MRAKFGIPEEVAGAANDRGLEGKMTDVEKEYLLDESQDFVSISHKYRVMKVVVKSGQADEIPEQLLGFFVWVDETTESLHQVVRILEDKLSV
ncbi:hypothetical protein LTR56_001964 [Elasticomyces elasticus]|nr:hypothetical protein LTR22_011550 [Elasticomyces elasticus]KAK3658108.1 hypothetical protein LTR56_001964 [Elasticomyces elasticus]KAK4914905.1 hypothetical protein LTR49_016894 [Elasticomyces elasticus]